MRKGADKCGVHNTEFSSLTAGNGEYRILRLLPIQAIDYSISLEIKNYRNANHSLKKYCRFGNFPIATYSQQRLLRVTEKEKFRKQARL